jgi:hypothetical protein
MSDRVQQPSNMVTDICPPPLLCSAPQAEFPDALLSLLHVYCGVMG